MIFLIPALLHVFVKAGQIAIMDILLDNDLLKFTREQLIEEQGWITGMQSLRFERNVANDKLHGKQLEELGWKVITLWECELKKNAFIERMSSLEAEIRKRQ